MMLSGPNRILGTGVHREFIKNMVNMVFYSMGSAIACWLHPAALLSCEINVESFFSRLLIYLLADFKADILSIGWVAGPWTIEYTRKL